MGPRGRVLIRSDGGHESAKYLHGGTALDPASALALGDSCLLQRRAVIVLEEVDRLSNVVAAAIRVDRASRESSLVSFTVEALGSGFDVADLSRGGIAPAMRAVGATGRIGDYSKPRASDYRVEWAVDPRSIDERFHRRLAFLGRLVIPVLDPSFHNVDSWAAAEWLSSRGYLGLWRPLERECMVRALPALQDAMCLVLAEYRYRWRCLSLSYSRFDGGRVAFWDVVDGERKFSAGRNRLSRVYGRD